MTPEISHERRATYHASGVGGMRLECPVLVTPDGGEMLARTPLAMTVIEV